MKYDLNEIIISGTINSITDNKNDYIKFGLTTLKYDERKVLLVLILTEIFMIYIKIFLLKEQKYL